MAREERREGITAWWQDISLWGGMLAEPETEGHLFQAFSEVLQAVPVEIFRQFLELNPLVMCQEHVSAAVLGFMADPVDNMGGVGHWQPVMYFAPTVGRMTKQNLVDQVAHEIAHVILGYYRQDLGLRRSTREVEADQLSQQWRFRPRYTRAMRRRVEAQEEA